MPENNIESFFQDWADDIWALVHFGRPSEDEFKEDFFEVSQGLKIRKFFFRKEKLETDSERGLKLAGQFVRTWQKRMGQNSRRKLGIGNEKPSTDSVTSQILQYGLLIKKFPISLISSWTGVSERGVKFRALKDLKEVAKIDESRFKPLGRDCVRHDLYFLDFHLELPWKDPLNLFSRKTYQKHVQSCERCEKLEQELQKAIQRIRMRRLARMSPQVREEFLQELSNPLGWASSSPLGSWPWYIKTPLQMAVVGVVLYATLSIPYVGTLIPGFSEAEKKVSATLKEGFVVSWQNVSQLYLDLTRKSPEQVSSEVATNKQGDFVIPESPEGGSDRVAGLEAVDPQKGQALDQKSTTNLTDTWTKGTSSTGGDALALVDEIKNSASEQSQILFKAPSTPPAPQKNPIDIAEKKANIPSTPPSMLQANAGPPVSSTLSPVVGERVFYRWGAFSNNLELDTQTLVQILARYESEKAGDLDLGATYRGGSYFHFMVPAEQFDKLVEEVRNTGLTQFTNTRATSDRVTPAGKRRIVFLVKPQKP